MLPLDLFEFGRSFLREHGVKNHIIFGGAKVIPQLKSSLMSLRRVHGWIGGSTAAFSVFLEGLIECVVDMPWIVRIFIGSRFLGIFAFWLTFRIPLS